MKKSKFGAAAGLDDSNPPGIDWSATGRQGADMKRDLRFFLVLELAATALAMISFRFIEVRWQAAMVAGLGFVAMGTWLVLKTLRWPKRFRYLTFYLARINLWLFALPLLLVRLRFLGAEFSQIHFLGIPAPMYHRASELAFLILVIGTAVDLLRVSLAERKLSPAPKT